MRKWEFRTKTHNKKRVFGGKTWNGFVIVKSLGKYGQVIKLTASTVAMLHTRLPETKRRNEGFHYGVLSFWTYGDNTPFTHSKISGFQKILGFLSKVLTKY